MGSELRGWPRAFVCVEVLTVLAALIAPARPAAAYSGGIAGTSGKPPSGTVLCNNCHSGGRAPTVRFDGPSQVGVGAMATFQFIVTSTNLTSQRGAGLDVAASTGVLAVAPDETDAQLAGGEITHVRPKLNDVDGNASWSFTWKAPSTPGNQTLYGAGNSVNLNTNTAGDASSRTSFVITVFSGPTATPTDTPTPSATPSPTSTPIPTATPTDTATATPTDTPTVTATPTDTVTPTQTPLPCVGDCDHNRTVTITELVFGVRVGLGRFSVNLCPAFDGNMDSKVTVDEIVLAVNSALTQCPR